MIAGWIAVLTALALAYLCALFALAQFAATSGRAFVTGRARPYIYALALAVYCTSWTFFGSVGRASTHGFDFLATYVSPIIVFALCHPLLRRVARLTHTHSISSVADFVASRYGKSGAVAALVAFICLVGVVPYIALQLKAISRSLAIVLNSDGATHGDAVPDLTIGVAVVLAGFAIAFGARRIELTERQDGLVSAIAAESAVKLLAFVGVGAFVTWGVFAGFGDLVARAAVRGVAQPWAGSVDVGYWAANVALSGCCVLLLPRQFHLTFVENHDDRDIRTAAWVFPLYLIAINVFVVPLVMAGLIVFADGAVDRDMTVLALPLSAHAPVITVLALVGGLSAATAMVIVECVALSVMVSNDLVMPLALRALSGHRLLAGRPGRAILVVRRLAIVLMLALGYFYLEISMDAALASIGLLSFSAIAQVAPCFSGGLFWRRATARGAIAGLVAGMLAWGYTLLLPALKTPVAPVAELLRYGPWAVGWLRPEALFGLNLSPLAQGVLISLTANILAFVAISLTRRPTAIEEVQADIFLGHAAPATARAARPWRAAISVSELEASVAQYLGAANTRRLFEQFLGARGVARSRTLEVDIHLFRFAEQQLASAIGAASSRLVLSLLLRRRTLKRDAALKLIDEASAALQYNRDMLQQALDFARQGVTVIDREMRLICWNREFRELFDLAPERLRVGAPLGEIVRHNAERGLYGPGDIPAISEQRIKALIDVGEPSRLRLHSGETIATRSASMPDGGLVTTYTNITEAVSAEEALAATNETLERRVRERTDELLRLNAELAKAKAEADAANLSKTRFLAAASHDILQPLNAARLYATSLVERINAQPRAAAEARLARDLDASLEGVEDILAALLEISRLDAGAMRPELSNFPVRDIFDQLRVQFESIARAKNLEIVFAPCALSVRSDRRLLRRVLQNLVANAIKYTRSGRVLVGCRRRGASVEIQVWDTGIGIPLAQQAQVFREFERLPDAAGSQPGIGLGLSIVERICKVLDHPVRLRSIPHRGSMFSVGAPVAPHASSHERLSMLPSSRLPLRGLRVLAIDNDARIREGMRALLAGWGCEVHLADGLAAARALLAQTAEPPDVAIADFRLDEEDGLTAIAALRAERPDGALAAVLLTADRTPEIHHRAMSEDVRVLHKPLKPAALRALLSQWRLSRSAAE